ncbi:MAG TPA: Coenzyme F420 hydrogenase/dehydrogenase, beta subunit C-terminal domain [Caulobacteraceae bacterium]|nr:Coenzyme F420 hydrogenase/dehydrogenase, beta subunit C-terminal domain [Caulobacteraceae bacterium]
MRLDAFGELKPSGDRRWLHGRSETVARTCPFSPAASNEDALAEARFPAAPSRDTAIGRYEAAWVGHAAEGGFRAVGSSGGMANWTAAELLRLGLVDAVAHVAPTPADQDGELLFRYRISRSLEQLEARAKSRYHPIELSEVIREIRSTPGRYAVVGLPCFVKAVLLLRAADPVLRERIVHTLGLFCGHMKSARMVESFAWQAGTRREDVQSIDFRHKDASRPANWYRAALSLRNGETRLVDWWPLVDGDWGAGFFQSEACNFCDDVAAETADVAFGDAWLEPYSSDGRGTNVVVARHPVIRDLIGAAIDEGRLALAPVDADFVRRTQAAGFRQRREGLALRLASRRCRPVTPRKRVAPGVAGLTLRRRLVYRLRGQITRWSRRMFWLARFVGRPAVYLVWARAALILYQAATYSRGRLGLAFDRAEAGLNALSRRVRGAERRLVS